MKAILMSIRPEWIAKILNGEKTIEIRKKFPSDYAGWVYIYCTKDVPLKQCEHFRILGMKCANKGYYLNGKVVARFWVDKVEYVENTYDEFRWGEEDYSTETFNPDVLYEKSCLSFEKMDKYLKGDCGYAIHITNVQPFDKPKEISEFKCCLLGHNNCVPHNCQECPATKPLTRAPQSWCYIEI